MCSLKGTNTSTLATFLNLIKTIMFILVTELAIHSGTDWVIVDGFFLSKFTPDTSLHIQYVRLRWLIHTKESHCNAQSNLQSV